MHHSQALPQIVARAKLLQNSREKTTNHDQVNLRQADKQGECLIVPPISDHRQTFILLHGRGDEARWFGGGLLDTEIEDHMSLQKAFPHAKFIFPQAPQRACARQPGWVLRQWFDNWGYDASAVGKEDLNVPGLHETTAMVHDLMRQEITTVGAEQVVVGGLSQGCAASLVAVLIWDGDMIGGYFGMCGHLPFEKEMKNFVSDSELTGDQRAADAAASWLKEKVRLPAATNKKHTMLPPIFIGHGDSDTVVPTQLGRDAANCLLALGARSKYYEYPGLVHWYSPAMLKDIIDYLKSNTLWDI